MSNLTRTYWGFRNKISKRLLGSVHMHHKGKKKGDVLISYITAPFVLFPWQIKTDPHSNYWECREIAKLFSVRGYAVDIIDANSHTFIPKKPYVACIDVQQDLDRLAKYLPPNCKKVIHIDNPYYKEYNRREEKRIAYIKQTRGITLPQMRHVIDSDSVAVADFLEGFGNENVHATYKQFGKPIFPIPISVAQEFDFPDEKNYTEAKKNFLYFGGGGAALKGLGIALEAFAELPHLHLYVVGPASFEPNFAKAYEKELSLPNITRYGRPKINKEGKITVNEEDFSLLANKCGAIIYPSAAEGTSGAVIQALHAGLIPIITPETGLDSRVGGVVLNNPTVESVKKVAEDFSKLGDDVLKRMAHTAWSYVRAHHTKETFSNTYGKFIDNVLKL